MMFLRIVLAFSLSTFFRTVRLVDLYHIIEVGVLHHRGIGLA